MNSIPSLGKAFSLHFHRHKFSCYIVSYVYFAQYSNSVVVEMCAVEESVHFA